MAKNEIPMLLGKGRNDHRVDWVSLPKPWNELNFRLRDRAVSAVEILTFDKGLLRNVDGHWEVVRSGDAGDADLVLNVLRRPC